PNDLAFSQQRLLVVLLQRADLLRWDLARQLQDWQMALHSPWCLPWWPTQACARVGAEVAPDTQALEFLRQFENGQAWSVRSEPTRKWLASLLARKGDETWARQLNLKVEVPR